LAVAGDDPPVAVEVERYQCRDIEVEDTASMRVTLHSGLSIAVAVTLCAEEFVPGEILVHGTEGTAVLEYPTDRLDGRLVPGRVSLLDNLLAYRADPAGTELLVPLARTEPFTALQAAVQAGPPPDRIEARHLDVDGGTVTLRGVNAAVRAAADTGALFSELDVPWATKPHRTVPERPGD
jgi:predicted dehydrogenase